MILASSPLVLVVAIPYPPPAPSSPPPPSRASKIPACHARNLRATAPSRLCHPPVVLLAPFAPISRSAFSSSPLTSNYHLPLRLLWALFVPTLKRYEWPPPSTVPHTRKRKTFPSRPPARPSVRASGRPFVHFPTSGKTLSIVSVRGRRASSRVQSDFLLHLYPSSASPLSAARASLFTSK